MTLETVATLEPEVAEAAEVRRERGSRLPIIDSDGHPTVATVSEFRPYLSERWWRYWQSYGARPKHGFAQGDPFPKAAPRAARRDAWTAEGRPPGSDLEFMRGQYLDALSVEYGILAPLFPTGQGDRNPEFAAAICSAVNNWQRDKWTRPEKRQQKAGSQLTPDSISTTLSSGNLAKTPRVTRLASCACRPCV